MPAVLLTTVLTGTATAVGLAAQRPLPDTATPQKTWGSTPPRPSTSEPTPRPRTTSDQAPSPEPRGAPPAAGSNDSTRADPIVIAKSGSGNFTVTAQPVPPDHAATAAELTYTMEIEDGLPFDLAATATTIDRILDDERGWTGVAGRSFHQVTEAGELRILLATPGTTDELCAPLDTNGEVSCRNGDMVVLNARRWAFATEDYQDLVPMYRTYLVNHEVGHAIDYDHISCPGPGEPAPVMQQQTYGLDGCRRNAWPSIG